MSAFCSSCKTPVGCGCNLRNGMCAACFNSANPQTAAIQRPQPQPILNHPQVINSVLPQQNVPTQHPTVSSAYWTR